MGGRIVSWLVSDFQESLLAFKMKDKSKQGFLGERLQF
jgi:hypothetical protein